MSLALASLASPAALADVHIKDPTHAGMQKMPALFTSLHHLSVYDDQGDLSRARAEAHDLAEQARQQRERKEQQVLDERAAVRARQFEQLQKNQEKAE